MDRKEFCVHLTMLGWEQSHRKNREPQHWSKDDAAVYVHTSWAHHYDIDRNIACKPKQLLLDNEALLFLRDTNE